MKTIKAADANKAHSYDNIRTSIIKLCEKSILKAALIILKVLLMIAFYLIFRRSLILFWLKRKTSSRILMILIQFLLYLFLEEMLFNLISKFLRTKIFLVQNSENLDHQNPANISCSQMVHDIPASFGCFPSLKVGSIFLEISQAFDWIWHQELIYKLQSLGTFDHPQTHIERFLRNRFQRVVLTGLSSSCSPGLTDVHQESVLEPR